MQPWRKENGTLWVWDSGSNLPPRCPARVNATFQEASPADMAALKVAMGLSTTEAIRARLHGKRRCFTLKADGQIATYGWISFGPEHVGELERTFQLPATEAYVWDCGTVRAWRGQRCYSAFLNEIIYHLHNEGVPRIWIGSSQQNQPSVKGFINAGFQHVIDLTYRRFYGLTILWLQKAPAARPALTSAACQILINGHERRLGPLAIGYKR